MVHTLRVILGAATLPTLLVLLHQNRLNTAFTNLGKIGLFASTDGKAEYKEQRNSAARADKLTIKQLRN